MTLDANKALIRDVFEKVIPAGDPAGLRDLVAPDWIDHDPLPGTGRPRRRRVRRVHDARRPSRPALHYRRPDRGG